MMTRGCGTIWKEDCFRLYYHPESDGLFWDNNEPTDGLCEDVTGVAKFHQAADARGLKCPGYIAKEPHGGTPAKVKTGGLAGAITASYKAWERKPADFYPTPFDVTESLIPLIGKIAEAPRVHSRPFQIWEPCCGDLDMTRVLQWHGFEVTSTDIRDTGIIPFGEGFGGFDFLNDDPVKAQGWEPEPDMIVMNPPFNLAAEFIAKALTYTPNVACLMKIDYWNAISRLPLWENRQPQFYLPLTWRPAFLAKERGNSPLMNCAWCVWTDQGDQDLCAMEPLRKRAYPGYREPGLRTAMSRLCQALDDCTEVISNVRTNA